MKAFIKLLVFFCIIILPLNLQAASNNILFKMDFGLSPVKFTVGDTYNNTSLGMGMTANVQIDYLLESLFASMGLYYRTIIGSDFGLIPLNEVGFSFTYYPYNFIKEKILVDNQVSMSIKKVLPFISVDAGATSFSINDAKGTKTSFNSILMDISVLFGVMFPYGQNLFFTTSVGYMTSFGGAAKPSSDGSTLPAISFNSVALLVGFAYNP